MRIIIILFLILTSCITTPMIPYPSEIKEDGGKIYRRCTAEQYVVDQNGSLSGFHKTSTYFYLYEKEDYFYWRIERCEQETQNTFFPRSIIIKVDNRKVNDKGDPTYYGTDINTGERYFIGSFSWEEGLGYYYIVGDEENQIIYSIPYSNIKYR